MPELPEVESVRRELAPRLAGTSVWSFQADTSRAIRSSRTELQAVLSGATIQGLARKGKFLFFHLDKGVLLVHLGMSGRLRLVLDGASDEPAPSPGGKLPRHCHFVAWLTDRRRLEFWDPRMFGRLQVFPPDSGELPALARRLGPDPLGAEYRYETFIAALERRPGTRLKLLLLDQTFVAGVGNIYADEVLFRCAVRPDRVVRSLSVLERRRLFEEIPRLLEEAVAAGGTTWRDFLGTFGERGRFAGRLLVYGREGRPCYACGAAVRKIVLGGRGTHFCPHCQS
ncbi:MAG: DNA-formamidopyrimidine glycosylase [Acidobacteriota bacterium]